MTISFKKNLNKGLGGGYVTLLIDIQKLIINL